MRQLHRALYNPHLPSLETGWWEVLLLMNLEQKPLYRAEGDNGEEYKSVLSSTSTFSKEYEATRCENTKWQAEQNVL